MSITTWSDEMQIDSKKLFSPNSAAQALDLSRSKIYDLMKSGSLRFVTVGSDRRIPASEIERIATQMNHADLKREPCSKTLLLKNHNEYFVS